MDSAATPTTSAKEESLCLLAVPTFSAAFFRVLFPLFALYFVEKTEVIEVMEVMEVIEEARDAKGDWSWLGVAEGGGGDDW